MRRDEPCRQFLVPFPTLQFYLILTPRVFPLSLAWADPCVTLPSLHLFLKPGTRRTRFRMLTVALVGRIMKSTSHFICDQCQGWHLWSFASFQFWLPISVCGAYPCIPPFQRRSSRTVRPRIGTPATTLAGLTEWLPTSPKGFHRLKRPPVHE